MDCMTHGWGMGLGWLLPLLIVGLLVYILQNKQEGKSSAQDLLDKRYAKGEIDEEEYEKKSRHLKENS